MDTRTFDALTESMKSAYVAGLSEGAVPRPVIMPLVRGELVGLIWLRPVKSGEDALTAIASLSNIAAAANADEIVLAWETQDVATTCELPADGPSPCLNMVHATKDGHTLHQFPYTEDPASAEPHWQPVPGSPARRQAAAARPGRGRLRLHSPRTGPSRPRSASRSS
jgi:hypothetical protein